MKLTSVKVALKHSASAHFPVIFIKTTKIYSVDGVQGMMKLEWTDECFN
jgi:hypothetical protein